jgi:hypothetical protein
MLKKTVLPLKVAGLQMKLVISSVWEKAGQIVVFYRTAKFDRDLHFLHWSNGTPEGSGGLPRTSQLLRSKKLVRSQNLNL